MQQQNPSGAGRIRERAMSSMVTTRGRMAIKDFTTDILTTFPEYKNDLDAGLLTIVTGVNNISEVEQLFEYIKQVYPERFFDLLYQNEDMFTKSTRMACKVSLNPSPRRNKPAVLPGFGIVGSRVPELPQPQEIVS